MSAQLQLIPQRDVAALIGVRRETIWKWSRDGSFPKPIRIGRLTRFRQVEVLAWILSRQSGDSSTT